MANPVKEFVLTHFIEDIQQITNGEQLGQPEEHFNVPWQLSFHRNGESLSFFLICLKPLDPKNWSIETEFEMKIISPKSDTLTSTHRRLFTPDAYSWGFREFITTARLEKYYSDERKVTLVAHVKVLKMNGIENGKKKKLRSFDDPELSDVVLVVNDQKFSVLKKFLALQSTYFKSLLLGNFDESKQSEVVLKDIDSGDFQNFLELIHGESSMDDSTIDGILHLAEMYDAPTAIRRCEEFLIKESKKTVIKKLELSVRYKLEMLKEKCLSEIKTVNDIRSVVNSKLEDTDGSIAKALLPKLLTFH